MTLEECEKNDGKYTLLECKDRNNSEFWLTVKDGKAVLKELQLSPFKVLDVKEDDFDLLCDLHEDENWMADEDIEVDK